MGDKLIDNIVEMQEQKALQQVQEMMDNNVDVMKILSKCKRAMEIVGERYEKGDYFVPQLMMAAEIMTQITDMTKDIAQGKENEEDKSGTIVMGTVEGDIHDIGKGIVNFNLDVNGFQVIDLGEDVTPAKYIEAIKEYEPDVVGMSCLLTVAFDSMKNTIAKIGEAGLRDEVKIMIGGAPINDEICKYTDADDWAEDAVKAVKLAKKWTGV